MQREIFKSKRKLKLHGWGSTISRRLPHREGWKRRNREREDRKVYSKGKGED